MCYRCGDVLLCYRCGDVLLCYRCGDVLLCYRCGDVLLCYRCGDVLLCYRCGDVLLCYRCGDVLLCYRCGDVLLCYRCGDVLLCYRCGDVLLCYRCGDVLLCYRCGDVLLCYRCGDVLLCGDLLCYRCGDVYEALRDTERALALCSSHQKSLRRRIKCLRQLGLIEEARQYLDKYNREYSDDSSFITQCRLDIDKSSEGVCVCVCVCDDDDDDDDDDDANTAGNHNGYHHNEHRQLPQWEELLQQTSCDYHQRYIGHCNTHTDIKEASFLGETAEYVAAGSDDGIIFIWDKLTGNLVRGLQGDESIVNCIQWHPQTAMLATSGIESMVRLWQPGSNDQTRVVDTLFKTGKANQQRMRMDPFEIMLMRMGLRMAMIGNDLHGEGGGAQGGAAAAEDSGAFYVEQSGRCRQS